VSLLNSNIEQVDVLISIGTNSGEREENIELAYEQLFSSGALCDAVMSSFYETEPVGILEQEWFLNVAVKGKTTLSPIELLQFFKNIEYLIGRKKRKRWTEREIDIDLIFYGSQIINEPFLIVPHERMYKRKFVLMPAAEIAPEMIHPVLKLNVKQLLDECTDSSVVKLYC